MLHQVLKFQIINPERKGNYVIWKGGKFCNTQIEGSWFLSMFNIGETVLDPEIKPALRLSNLNQKRENCVSLAFDSYIYMAAI